jgi:hypothetical protein
VKSATPKTGPVMTPDRRAPTAAALAHLHRLDVRFPAALVVVAAVGLAVAGQLAEDLADSKPLEMLPPVFTASRWTVVAVVAYMLLISRVVDRTVQRAIPSIERVMKVEAPIVRSYIQRLQPVEVRTNLVLLAASAIIVTTLFAGLGLEMPVTDNPETGEPLFLPPSPLGAVAVLAGYTVLGWAGLSLIYLTVRLGRALGALCREPLAVDVFDTTNLLPLGNIALAGALAPVGIIVIFLVGLGEPTHWISYIVLLLAAVASLLALLLPLRGVHRQMSDAKDAVVVDINARLAEIYDEVRRSPFASPEIPGLNGRTNTLIPLRKTVAEMTTWPFADTVSFGRAILIASAPLIYTVLSELIKVFWINGLGAGTGA